MAKAAIDEYLEAFSFARAQVQPMDIVTVDVDSFQALLTKAWARFPKE
jgi:hypothetical protein